MKRKIFTSAGMKSRAENSPNGKIEIYSFLPNDKSDCDCQKIIHEFKEKLAGLSESGRQKEITKHGFITCPRDKAGMNRYEVTCNNCGEILGYCWATNDTLTDWCDFHYTSWTDGNEWHGCFTTHISPITEKLCLECTCGQDTRDFRANMTLPAVKAFEIEKDNSKGRDFGKTDSKFKASVVDKNVIPFKGGK